MGTPAGEGDGDHSQSMISRLGPFLCWAVVFADIGTSVYYVPGILYGQFGRLAGFFVFLTLSVFVLLTLKYAEVTARFPEGGGVVTVATRAISPWAGALGGMLILVDYFLTAAISSDSGLTYFQVIWPGIGPIVLWATVGVLVVLGLLNWWGIRESASVSAAVAVLALVSDLVVLLMVVTHVPLPTIASVFGEMFSGKRLTPSILLTGFAGSFLAFSGLESISQLSPVMRVPRRTVAGWALALVVITVGITSPFLTVFATTLLCPRATLEGGFLTCLNAQGKPVDPNQFISALGSAYGGPWLGIAVAISASALLIFASNTAIIGSYHVFLALTRMKFFPPIVGRYNEVRHTPHVAIALSTGIPILVLIAVEGRIDILGDMYAFGLLGAFTLTCLGLDIVRWRERQGGPHVGPTPAEEEMELRRQQASDDHLAELRARGDARSPLATWVETGHGRIKTPLAVWVVAGRERIETLPEPLRVWQRPAVGRLLAQVRGTADVANPSEVQEHLHSLWPTVNFALGVLTTLLVMLAWFVNLVNKHLATEFGGAVTAVGMLVAYAYHQRLERAGQPRVFPMVAFGRIPNSVLVVLPPGASDEARRACETVVRTACENAGDRTLVFLYVAPAEPTIPTRILEIDDPYARNTVAQEAFSRAEAIARQMGIPRKRRAFVYRVGGLAQVADVWRVLRPEETIALANQKLSRTVQPDYVRIHDVDGQRVASYIHHVRGAGGTTGGPPTTRPTRDESAARPR